MDNSLEQSLHSPPRINHYVSALKYLGDYYQYRKILDPKFSYEVWSVELGFQSKSSVSMVCRGQKVISDSFVESFSKKTKLDAEQKDFLYLLAHYQNAKKPILKRAYLDKIIERVDATANTTELKNYIQFLSSPALPILQLIISFKDFKATETKIKKMTGLEDKKIAQYLNILQKLGLAQVALVETEKDRVWTSCIKHFKISDDMHEEALDMFHQSTTREAHDVLKLKNELKRFKSLFFSMNEENYVDLSKDIDDFISKIRFKYANDFLNQKQLFKVNLQVYPVTKKLDDSIG